MLEKVGLGLLAVAGIFVLGIVLALPSALAIMLVSGALHLEVFPQMPAFSFWQSIILHFALVTVGSYFKPSDSSSK